jgi:hypothetical protein
LAVEDHLGAAEAEPPASTQSMDIGSSPVSSSTIPLVASSPDNGLRPRSLCMSEEVAHSQAEEPAPHLGAAEADPPAPTQSVDFGSSSVSSSALPLVALSPEDGVRTGSSTVIQQNPPVCLSKEVSQSQAEEPASQARLEVPETSDAGLPVQVHQIEDAVAGSDQGTFSEAKLVSTSHDLPASPWEEASGSGAVDTVKVSANSAPEKARSLIRRGFFGPRAASPTSLRGSSQGKGALSSSLPGTSVLSLGAAEVGLNPT